MSGLDQAEGENIAIKFQKSSRPISEHHTKTVRKQAL